MELNDETVQCYLYALLNEAKSRGGMFPQTSDAQESDSDAVHRVCDMVRWYAKQNYPRSEAVEDLRVMRARNASPNALGQEPCADVCARSPAPMG